MDKAPKGFTLLEIAIGMAVVGVMAMSVVPNMNAVLDKQTLKVKVSRIDAYVDQARNLAATTECPVQMTLKPQASAIDVNVTVELDPFLKGCSAWFSQTQTASNRGFRATLDDVKLLQSVNLRFNAVSGILDANNPGRLRLNYRTRQAEINYLGIGNAVVKYE